jgi:hypothetical protein
MDQAYKKTWEGLANDNTETTRFIKYRDALEEIGIILCSCNQFDIDDREALKRIEGVLHELGYYHEDESIFNEGKPLDDTCEQEDR